MPKLSENGRKEYARLRRQYVQRVRRGTYAAGSHAADCLSLACEFDAKPDARKLYTLESVWRP